MSDYSTTLSESIVFIDTGRQLGTYSEDFTTNTYWEPETTPWDLVNHRTDLVTDLYLCMAAHKVYTGPSTRIRFEVDITADHSFDIMGWAYLDWGIGPFYPSDMITAPAGSSTVVFDITYPTMDYVGLGCQISDVTPVMPTYAYVTGVRATVYSVGGISKNTNKLTTDAIQVNDAFGKSDQIFVYIYDNSSSSWVEVEGVDYFKVEKRLNQMSKFEMSLPQIEDTQKLYVKEFARVLLISNQKLILKGRIQKVNYETSYSCKIEGFGMEAVILDKEYRNITRSPTDEDRVQYDNDSAQLIAKELLSTNADGVAPWTMPFRTSGIFATDYGDISMRFEYANKLTALGNLTSAIKYDWWVENEPLTYATDYFHLESIKGNQADPSTDTNRQFTITGPLVNAEGTGYQRDVTNLTNYIKMIGYGDGINQLFTSTYNASPIWTTLATNITAAVTTISLVDASAFTNSGTIRIAEEQITYTGKSGDDLTGCTRGANSTTALNHRAEVYVEKYVVYTSPEANSSISENGLMELTLTNRDIRDLSTLELVASKELIDRMTPIERITLTPSDPQNVAETLDTGDLVSIIDAESSLNSNYRIVAIIYENNYGSLSVSMEASNKSLTFIEQMQKEREKNQALQKYMQGATNVYVVSNSENCDNGYGCVVRTYIPADAIAINHVKLSYSVSAYRIYNTTTAQESPPHTHSLSISSEPADPATLAAVGLSSGTLYATYGAGSVATTAGSAHQHGTSYGISLGTNTVSSMKIFIDNVDKTTAIETQIGHTLSISQEEDIDIANLITSTGWHTLEVRPNGTCRISTDGWLQVFIESK